LSGVLWLCSTKCIMGQTCVCNISANVSVYIVSVLVPPCVADVDCALCLQLNKGTLLLLLYYIAVSTFLSIMT